MNLLNIQQLIYTYILSIPLSINSFYNIKANTVTTIYASNIAPSIIL